MMPEAARYRFGPFLLEPALWRLLRDSEEIALPRKAFDILVLLVRARDRVLTKQELLDAIWADTAVTENTLTQRIREIREALEDDAQEPRYVRTVSRVGYRFVGDVTEEPSATLLHKPVGGEPSTSASRQVDTVQTARGFPPVGHGAVVDPPNEIIAVERSLSGPPVEADTSSPGSGAPGSVRPTVARSVLERPQRSAVYAAAVAIVALGGVAVWFATTRPSPAAVDGHRRIESIAVLPLENLSNDPDQDYFADGMTDQLITELARRSALRVISRTSALQYKGSTRSVREIGSELNVDAVVEGSVLRAGQQARITLKLVDVATDRTLLAESYARELQDILALQSEIARAVAEQIRSTVAPDPPGRVARRVIPQAYDDYLMGRASWGRERLTACSRRFSSSSAPSIAIQRLPRHGPESQTATSPSAVRCWV
jgi:TolB-like protein/DNA-binding winged helix-turn-helix (wHTH) protein